MVKLNLYVWDDFNPAYTSGLAFAIAESEDEAKKMILDQIGFEPSYWGDCKIYTIDKIAFWVSGGG